MKKKLVHFQILDAKGYVCVFNEDDEDAPVLRNILKPDARRSYSIPRYILVGLYDTGETIATGINSLAVMNSKYQDVAMLGNHLFMTVTFNMFLAFVHNTMVLYDENEARAVKRVFRDLVNGNVTMTDGVLDYVRDVVENEDKEL